MFTGIIEELGKINRIIKASSTSSLEITCKKILEDIEIGASISVNGICLTVTKFSANSFYADVMNETYKKTSLSTLKKNDVVNLERAMPINSRFSGHIVSGHIDGTGKISSIKKDNNSYIYKIKAKKEILDLIVEKGSIAIDGISLTVFELTPISFSVSIIPHTNKVTILHNKKIGDLVNLENDIFAKYIIKITKNKINNKNLFHDFKESL